jgi:hypothetical protein
MDDQTRKEIHARVAAFAKQYEQGCSGDKMMNAFAYVLELNQQYGAQNVRDVLRDLNGKINGPLN